jgi:hypothetical protein
MSDTDTPNPDDLTDDSTTTDVQTVVGDDVASLGEIVGDGELVPIGDTDLETVENLLSTMQTLAVNDTEQVAARLAVKKLQARSVDELNAIGELVDVGSILNTPVLVSELHWNESRIAGSNGAYAVFDATNPYTGECTTVGSGHMDVMITLFQAMRWGLLPVWMQFSTTRNPNRFGKPTYVAKILTDDDVKQLGLTEIGS